MQPVECEEDIPVGTGIATGLTAGSHPTDPGRGRWKRKGKSRSPENRKISPGNNRSKRKVFLSGPSIFFPEQVKGSWAAQQ